MELRYNFRLYPGPGPSRALAQVMGSARVVWNDAIAARQAAHRQGLPFPTTGDLSKLLITQAKRTAERAWLSAVSAVPLQQALRDQDRAWRAFFRSLARPQEGRVCPPGFRSRKSRRQSVRFTNNAGWKITPGGRLSLPKVGEIPVRWSRALPSAPTSVTIVKDAAGRYWASFVITTDTAAALDAAPTGGGAAEAGIDLGLTCFAVLSDGTRVSSPRFLRRAEKKLRRTQRQHSRKQKGSKNREKARIALAKQHARVADRRRDFHHKLSTKIISENQAVYVEDLAVAALVRGRASRSVHDAGWAAFLAMLEYKAKRDGRVFCRVDRWFPSTKTCSRCRHVKAEVPLSTRVFECEACGLLMDRDQNAAHNILAEGRKVAAGQRESAATPLGGVRRRETPDGALVRPRPKVPARRVEAGTHPKPDPTSVRKAGIVTASRGEDAKTARSSQQHTAAFFSH
ncbi:RNA-guided endonuclease InsQ/TnpB family protein [Streptomyces sp. 2-6]|uniref:RNA-guided endonuclease InsQ/TnpB family protein n=1 Tax=Streptomyces sp. 2-6 TaxID=2978333 RepID=UPI003D0CF16F